MRTQVEADLNMILNHSHHFSPKPLRLRISNGKGHDTDQKLGDVEFEQERRFLFSVQEAGGLSHKKKIVLD